VSINEGVLEDGMMLSIRFVNKKMRKTKYLMDKACSEGNHGNNLRHAGFSGGFINWHCENCLVYVQQPDRPVTI